MESYYQKVITFTLAQAPKYTRITKKLSSNGAQAIFKNLHF